MFGVDDTTSIVTWHCPGTPALIAGIVPPVSAIGRVPGVAFTVKPQVLLATFNGLATTTPFGNVSVSATASGGRRIRIEQNDGQRRSLAGDH